MHDEDIQNLELTEEDYQDFLEKAENMKIDAKFFALEIQLLMEDMFIGKFKQKGNNIFCKLHTGEKFTVTVYDVKNGKKRHKFKR